MEDHTLTTHQKHNMQYLRYIKEMNILMVMDKFLLALQVLFLMGGIVQEEVIMIMEPLKDELLIV